MLHIDLHTFLHWQCQGDLIRDVLSRHQSELVSLHKESHSNQSFQSSQILAKTNTGSGMECRPLSLRFTTKFAFCCNPSFRLEFSRIRAPDSCTSSLSIRTYSACVSAIISNAEKSYLYLHHIT